MDHAGSFEDTSKLPIGAQRPYYVFFFPNVQAGLSPFPATVKLTAKLDAGDVMTGAEGKKLKKSEGGKLLKKLFRIAKPPHGESNPSTEFAAYLESLLLDSLKDAANGREEMPGVEFAEFCIKMFVWLMENSLLLTVKLIKSFDDTEIVCLVGATDQSYGRMANFQQHRLRFSVKPPKKNYGGVNPSTLLYRVNDPMNDLITYAEDNTNNLTPENKTVFSQLSKISLLHHHFGRVIYKDAWTAVGLVTKSFCLHDEAALKNLSDSWTLKSSWDTKTVRDIRRYFGELITLYFVCMSYIVKWLVVPSALGAFLWVISRLGLVPMESLFEQTLLISFAVVMSVWAMLLQKFWTRKERDLSWRWATYMQRLKESDVRDDGTRKKKYDPVTGTMRKPRTDFARNYKLAVSYLITTLLASLVLAAVTYIFSFQTKRDLTSNEVIAWGCAIGVQIYLSKELYSPVAMWLTEWGTAYAEDYGTETEFVEALSAKMFLFRVVNAYASLLYIAFIKVFATQRYREGCMKNNCFAELNLQLGALFFVQIVFKALERLCMWHVDKTLRFMYTTRRLNSEEAKKWLPCERQALLEKGLVSPFVLLDMIMNYGYVVMFATTFPLLALTVLLLTLYQTYEDRQRFLTMTKRPVPEPCFTLGIGKTLLDILSTLGAILNPAIMIFSTQYFESLSFEEQLFLFVAVEHGLFIVKLVIDNVIKDESEGEW